MSTQQNFQTKQKLIILYWLTGKLEKFVDLNWQSVDERDRFTLTKIEGQVTIFSFRKNRKKGSHLSGNLIFF